MENNEDICTEKEVNPLSPVQNYVSCKLTTESSTLDWKFWFEPQDLRRLQSEVFNASDRCLFKWKLHYIPFTTKSSSTDQNLNRDYLLLELLSKPKHNIWTEVDISFSSPNDENIATANASSIFTVQDKNRFNLLLRLSRDASEKIRSFRVYCNTCRKYNCISHGNAIVCRVTVTAIFPELGDGPTGNETTKQMIFDFSGLLINKKYFDVQIKVASTVLPAHRMIVAARSKVFNAMFEHGMQESQSNVIEIADFDEETIRQLLRFVYTSTLTTTETRMVLNVLLASDKYGMDDLTFMCEALLMLNMDHSNVIDILKHADLITQSNLKKAAIDYIVADPKHFFTELAAKSTHLLNAELLADISRRLVMNMEIKSDYIEQFM